MSGHEAPVAYHRALIDDATRIDAWSRAIRAVVRPGDIVLDAGSGSGLLAVLAARAGARVHAVESSSSVSLTRAVVRAHGLDSAIAVHHADLATLTLPEPVDVVLCDFIGRFVPDRAMHRAIGATARHGHADTRYLPSAVRLYIAPVGDILVPEVDAFRTPRAGVDLTAALPQALSTAYQVQLPSTALLAAPSPVGVLTPPVLPDPIPFEACFEATRAGTLRGFAGWFEADLGPARLDTRPGIQSFWGQVLWPVPPMRIARGTELAIRGEARPDGAGVHFAWHATGPELDHHGDTEHLPPFANIALEPLDRAATDEALRRGMESLRAGRLDEAIEALRAAARDADAHGVGGTCYEQLGLALLHAGRAQAALHAFTHALVLEPEREAPLRFLAPCLDRLGRQEELLEAVDRYECIHGPHPLVQRS